jgi:hypothetical protein
MKRHLLVLKIHFQHQTMAKWELTVGRQKAGLIAEVIDVGPPFQMAESNPVGCRVYLCCDALLGDNSWSNEGDGMAA